MRAKARAVGFQGEAGAYGEAAASILAPGLPASGFPSFDAVFQAVQSGDVLYGVIPVENVYAGPVDGQAGRWWHSETIIAGDLWFPIHHVLAGLPGSRLEDIRTVRSHPQALLQCAPYLRRHGYQPIATTNTASAAREVRDAGDIREAVLASTEAVTRFGLQILDETVTAGPGNRTRFWLIARESRPLLEGETHRISAIVAMSRPGDAAQALDALRQNGFRLERALPADSGHLLLEGTASGPLPPCPGARRISQYRRMPPPF